MWRSPYFEISQNLVLSLNIKKSKNLPFYKEGYKMSCKFCGLGIAGNVECHEKDCTKQKDPDSGSVLQYKVGFKFGLLNEGPGPSRDKVNKYFYLGYEMGKKERKM
jgi:hypothetical protein